MGRRSDGVDPFPGDLHPVDVVVGRVEDELGLRDLGWLEGAVRRDDRRDAAERGGDLVGESLEVAGRDRQALAVEYELLQPHRCGARKPHEPQLRAPRVSAGGRLGAHEAVPVAPEEEHRLDAVDDVVADPQHGLDNCPSVVAAGDVERELAVVAGHLAQALACVDERDAEAERLVEQRPELGAALAEVERLVGAGGVVVGHAALARPLGGAQTAEHGDLVGPILAVLTLPRLEPVPRQ